MGLGAFYLPKIQDARLLIVVFCIGFFGLVVAEALAQLVKPAVLTISESGFSVRRPLRERRWSWAEVANFRIENWGGPTVVFDELEPRGPAWFRTAFPFPGSLHGGWRMPEKELVELLVETQRRCLGAGTSGAP